VKSIPEENDMKTKDPRTAVLACAVLLALTAPALSAEESPAAGESGLTYVPILQYESLALGSQHLHAAGTGIVMLREGFMMSGLYSRHGFTEELAFEYPRRYHAVDLLADGSRQRHHYLFMLKSRSDEPVYGGVGSFQAAALDGWRLLEGERGSLVLGGGLAVSDFGIELADGTAWPVLPVPLIRASYETSLFSASFDFITGPNLSLILFPERRLRLLGDIGIDEYRDLRDLIFETAISYCPGFISLSLGYKNDVYSYDCSGEEESFELHYHALFGSLDLTLLKLSAGYAFNTRARYRESYTMRPEDGLFFSLEGMYQF
jgi:hypothetical protein